MLFNSYEFIFLFLPVCLAGYALLGRFRRRWLPIAWLVGCSLYYYAWWKAPELDHWTPRFLGVMVLSVAVNYLLGSALLRAEPRAAALRKCLLAAGVLFNFGLLVYFKYTRFFAGTANSLLGAALPLPVIVLPLAFSFHTFQQHAYLVDAYRCKAGRYSPLDYSLFVLFFPQLLAGPITHHHEMLPQFASHRVGRLRARHVSVGLTLFIMGLAKKVLIADRVAAIATPVFSAAARGQAIGFGSAWAGALAFTLQLYFDFSGYTDMAIGVARMFGIRLPLNFNSPYQAASIIDFWRRWHMTLSRWLRDYVYIPLGGNRRGPVRRWINLMLTMLLGGLWHGAGWTFVFWGGLHGAYLGINHAWRGFRDPPKGSPAALPRDFPPRRLASLARHTFAVALTFLAVTIAWVFFRAPDFRTAARILASLLALRGLSLASPFADRSDALLIALLLTAVWFLPNTQQILNRFRPALGYHRRRPNPAGIFQWRPNVWWAAAMVAVAVVVLTQLQHISEFIYYQF